MKPRGGGVTLLANLFSSEKVYATTGTFYPDADPETSTVDGWVYQYTEYDTFQNLRAATGNYAQPSSQDGQLGIETVGTPSTDYFTSIIRAITLFNTSSLGSDAVISGGTISLYGYSKMNTLGGTAGLILVGVSPNSNTDLITSDYGIGNYTLTNYGGISYSSFSTSGYNNITINANGLAVISKTGITKYAQLMTDDFNNSFSGVWIAGGYDRTDYYFSEAAGTSQDPKLVVTYTLPANPKQDVIWFD